MQNLLLVTIGSLRADHYGSLGSRYKTTARLGVLYGESIVFDNAIAPGPRTPSFMPVLFTGEHIQPENKGVYQNWEEKRTRWREWCKRIRQHLIRYRILAERLHECGYTNIEVTANPWTTRDTWFNQGFNVFRIAGDNPGMQRDGYPVDIGNRRTGGQSEGWPLRWIDFYDAVAQAYQSLAEPYFRWVFFLDAHQPHAVLRSYRTENTGLEIYYSNVRFSYNHDSLEWLADHLHTRFEQAYRGACRSVDGFVRTLLTDDGVTLLFSSEECFIEKIRKILINDQLRESMAKNANEAAQGFTWSQRAEALADIHSQHTRRVML